MKLTTRIKNSGLKMTFIAAKSGIGYTHLTKILSGKLELRPRTEEKLAKFAERYVK